MRKISFKPRIELQNYIDRFYYCDNIETESNLPLIMPGTGLDVFIHFKPSSYNDMIKSSSHFICPRKSLSLKSYETIQFIAIRFKTGMFRHFSNVPYAYLNNSFLSGDDIWGNDFEEILEEFYSKVDIPSKIQVLEDFIFKMLKLHVKKESLQWDCFNDFIYKNYLDFNIKNITEDFKISTRSFERNFKIHYGVTPKFFQKLVRLEKTIKDIKLNDGKLITALDHGYFDQSHFNKDFKELVGIRPKLILDKNFNDYYFKKH